MTKIIDEKWPKSLFGELMREFADLQVRAQTLRDAAAADGRSLEDIERAAAADLEIVPRATLGYSIVGMSGPVLRAVQAIDAAAPSLEDRQRSACRELGIGEEHAAAIGWSRRGDVLIDGLDMFNALANDAWRRGEWISDQPTPAQRAAVSAHWSAQLRALVAASREAERQRVVADDAARGLLPEDV